MATKHMKRNSISLVTEEMQIKPQQMITANSLEEATIKMTDNKYVVKIWENWKPLMIAGENVK